jgi:5,10-methylenetetrahydromethanopterin reductase
VISVFNDLFFQPAIFPLLTIARVTERVRLGPAALNSSTLHPVEIAGQIASLDLASNGRAYLGLTTGSWLDQLGLDESKPLTRLREAVEVVRRLHAGDTTGFSGVRFTLAHGAGLAYEPLRRRVPLMIGTWRPRAAALARRSTCLAVRSAAPAGEDGADPVGRDVLRVPDVRVRDLRHLAGLLGERHLREAVARRDAAGRRLRRVRRVQGCPAQRGGNRC